MAIQQTNKETIFNHKNIRIRTTYSPVGKHVEAMINHGDYFEIISTGDDRAHEAFIALSVSKRYDR